jgi:hypothetical protein
MVKGGVSKRTHIANNQAKLSMDEFTYRDELV